MASSWVAAYQNNNNAGATSLTVTIGTSATANNLLIACASLQGNPGTINTPTGWTKRQDHDSGSIASGAYFERIASGTSADDFPLTWTNSVESAITISEYSGLDATAPYENSTENTAYTTTDNGTDPIGSGSASPSTQPGRAISGFCQPDSRDGAEGEMSVDGGFSIDSEEQAGTGNTPSAFIASDPYTATSALECGWSSSVPIGWNGYSWIGFYKEAAAGGGGSPLAAGSLGLMGVGL